MEVALGHCYGYQCWGINLTKESRKEALAQDDP